MRRSLLLHTFVSCILMLVMSGAISKAQNLWEPVNGPYTGRVFAVCTDADENLYAGTERGGVFRSSDNGVSWNYSGLSYTIVRSLFLHSDGSIFAGRQPGLSVSKDQGVTWESVGDLATQHIFGIAATSTGVIYAGGYHGLNRSTDDGATFESVALGGLGVRINSICIGENDAIYCAMDSKGLIRSDDGGQSWAQVDTQFEDKNVFCVVNKDGLMLAAVQYAGVFYSTDAGATWTQSSTALSFSSMNCIFIRSAQQIWLATDKNQIYFSNDGGVSWVLQISEAPATSFASTSDGKVFAGTTWNGVLVTADDGTTWVQSNDGLNNLIPGSIGTFVRDSKNNLYYKYVSGEILKSTDGFESYTEISTGLNYTTALAIGPSDVLYAADQYDRVRHTSDDGITWLPDTTGLPKFSTLSLALSPQGDIAIGGASAELYVLEAGATVWRSALDAQIRSNITCLVWENGALFASTYSYGLFRSLDKGRTWAKLENGFNETNVLTIYSDHKGSLFVGALGAIYVSTDNGDSWTDISLGQISSVSAIAAGSDGRMYAASLSKGMYMSDPGITSWTDITSGLQNTEVRTLLMDDDGNLFASTHGNGIFRATPIVVSVKNPAALRNDVELHAAHPNPFTSLSQISFSLPTTTQVRIAIYDMTGREVALLVDGLRPAGTSDLRINASGLAPGMYLCRMNTGTTVLTQPLMILR
ncbi:MAG: T9SS type A sorting domain-containing protein [Bacteroidota bacterium]